jgi:TRAP transporter TAXI family solute receptor
MHAGLRETLVSLRELLFTFAPFVLLAAGLVYLAYELLDPTPPKRLVLATGQDQGAYAEFGRRYAQILKGNGVEVRLTPSAGAAENLALLRKGEVDVAFVQGGADPTLARAGLEDEPQDDLVSLGSLFYEPVWIFYRADSAERLAKAAEITALGQLAGWRVNIGAPGSGVPALMARLMEVNELDPAQLTLLQDTQTPAVVALLEGRSDAVVFASAPESLIVQMLLRTPGIRLFDFAQAEAYTRRLPFLEAVTLPRGVVDLARNLPPTDVRLIAPTATLLARKDTHPALVQLLVQAAKEVHGGAGWFQKKGDFPNPRNPERPLSAEAQRFYDRGPPALQRYMTFWVANLVDRMWPAILAILAALLPLSRVLPPLYDFRMRSRVFRWYRQLRSVESAIGKRPKAELLAELDAIEKKVEQVTVPLSYAEELYALRAHIRMVAGRLEGTDAAVEPAAAGTPS